MRTMLDDVIRSSKGPSCRTMYACQTQSTQQHACPQNCSARRRHRAPRVFCAGGQNVNSLGTALDLRSRLQQTDLARRQQGGFGSAGWEEVEGAWVRRPSRRAWGVVHFTGGAVLGGFPHLCYDAMLSSLSEASGLLVIATPYELGTDHDGIAEACAKLLTQALAAVCLADGYDASTLPLFGVGHSLGAKLQVLLACRGTLRYRAQAMVAFNNASATDSVRLLQQFARELLEDGRALGRDVSDAVLGMMPVIGAMAERAAAVSGLQFKPDPKETLRRAAEEYAVQRCMLVTFNDDKLDQNEELREELAERRDTDISTARRTGNHLTPVVVTLAPPQGLSQLSGSLPRSVGDEAAARELGADVGQWLQRAAMKPSNIKLLT